MPDIGDDTSLSHGSTDPAPALLNQREAAEMFGVAPNTWLNWERDGTLPVPQWGRSRKMNQPCKLYAVEELRRVIETKRGADKVYRDSARQIHVPEGLIRLQDVARMFGVDNNTWIRWEREGLIPFGQHHTRRRLKLYPVAEVEALLAECGRYAPPYPDPLLPGCHRVPLAGVDMQRREAIIDTADLPRVEGRRWHYSGPGAEHRGQVVTFNPGAAARLRQVILGASDSQQLIGHRNENPLDCRRANLFLRTRAECSAAARKAGSFLGQPCTSRFKGVCLDRRRGKWVVHIKINQKQKSLGQFHDEIAAAEAYDKAAHDAWGEHARLNFPTGFAPDVLFEPLRVQAEPEAADHPAQTIAA